MTDRFIHTAWTAEQGAPQDISVIAQTADGYLWFASRAGLSRFDGVRFEPYEPPRFSALPYSDISALMATPDDGLWIGYRTGGASFLKGSNVTSYSEKEGLPSAQVFFFAVDADGVLWASTSDGMCRFEGSHWNAIGPEWGLPKSGYHLFTDDARGLWAVSQEAVYLLPPHSHRFVEASRTAHGGFLLQTVDGTIWSEPGTGGAFADKIEIPQVNGLPAESARTAPKTRSRGCHAVGPICAPSDGSSWVGTNAVGIGWLPSVGLLAAKEKDPAIRDLPEFTQQDGLTSNFGLAILEDQEGDIWVSTKAGVDRFRPRKIYPALSGSGLPDVDLSLLADHDGVVWAGAIDQPLMRIQNDFVSTVGPPRQVVSMFRDHDGTIWIGGFGTLTRFAKNRFEELKPPEGLTPDRYWKFRSITEDKAGAVWVSVVQHGVFRLRNGQWEQYGNVPSLPRLTAFIVCAGSDGRTWFGYTDNRIAALDGEKVTTFSAADGLAIGNVTALGGRHGHVWAGGQFGLARLDGARFVMLTNPTDNRFRGISGIVEMDNGDLWINQTSGIAHIAAAELDAKIHDPHHQLKFELFDSLDGVRGTATQLNFLPSAILGTDGRIWVSGTDGASWIDPAHLSRNTLPPPVLIQSLVVDGKSYSDTAKIELPPLPSSLEIDYTALSLSVPERVHFRYKLEGADEDWQDAGTRRSAFYTKLKPNTYQFRVIACNNDGIWNEQGAALSFIVLPAFYQTWWFRVIYVAFAIGFLWLFYLYRIKLATAQVQERLGARMEERERIARELHDTLLQGFQGLMLRLQAVMKTLPVEEPTHKMIESVLDRADQVLLEGRQSVRDLREEGAGGKELSQALAHCGEELAEGKASLLSVSVIGTPRALGPIVFSEVYRIGREALINAFKHSQAAKIELDLTYADAQFCLRIRDDGAGIDPDILRSGKPGHWGLSGMRERANKIGARLHIWSKPNAGTEIELTVPADLAYSQQDKESFWLYLKRVITKRKDA